MIKASGRTGAGDALLLLGLSKENTRRLHADQPIRIYGQDVGMPGLVVVIIGGDTEDQLRESRTRHGLMDDRTYEVGGE